MRGERVPEQVRIHPHADALPACPIRYPGLHSTPPEALAAAADEQSGLPGFCDRDPLFQPVSQRAGSLRSDWNDARLVTFAHNTHGAVREIEAVQFQANELGEAQS